MNRFLVLTVVLLFSGSWGVASMASGGEEIEVNGVKVTRGFFPTSVERLQRSPDVRVEVKPQQYDAKRELYYFSKDPLTAQRFPTAKITSTSSESLVHSLSDGGYMRTMFVGEDAVVVSPLTYVAPWGCCGLLGAYILTSQLTMDKRSLCLGAALGAVGGGVLGETIRRRSSSSRSTESILGMRDRRTQVAESDVTNMPYSVHGRIKMSFTGGDYIGSGTLIGPRHVLTAAHNLYDSSKHEDVSALSFYPGSHGVSVPFAAEGVSWTVHPRYKTPRMPFEQRLYDMAVITISDDLGLRTGYFGYSELDRVEDNINVTGYPGVPGGGKFMYTMEGPIRNVTPERIFYDIDTSPGQSGSGVWKHIKGVGHYCVAVHAYGVDPADSEEAGRSYNSATLITKEKYGLIRAWTS